MRLCLQFKVQGSTCYLDRSSFWHPLLEKPLVAQRGTTTPRGTGTFAWSRAVQALSLLCVQSVLTNVEERPPNPLIGDAGTLAASLDSAISKQPSWVYQIFGADTEGTSLLRRLVSRVNPERKRPGAVEISIKSELTRATEIVVNGRICSAAEELRSLASLLFDQGPPQVLTFPPVMSPSSLHTYQALLEEIRREVHFGLHDTATFSTASIKNLLTRLTHYAPFQTIGGHASHLVGDLELQLSDSARLGLGVQDSWITKQLSRSTPIRLLCGVGAVTSLCIFRYLTIIKGYNLEISHNFSSSQDIVHTLRVQGDDEPVDGVIMALCCSVRLCQGQSSFSPLAMMPVTTHAQLSRGSGIERYLFLTDETTGSHFHLEDDVPSLKYRPKIESLPFAGLVDVLADHGDARAILFWPYYLFANNRNDWVMDPNFRRVPDYELVTLCVGKRISRDPKLSLALNVAIRDAWLTLRSNAEMREHMIQELLRDERFLSAFSRLGPSSMRQAI
jgi:hypothetical protein